jgi:adenosine deaminase
LGNGSSLTDIAALFASSAEFGIRYGSNPSDADYALALYQNVLQRAPDAAGLAFWAHAVGTEGKAQILIDFALSVEEQAQVQPLASHGVLIAPGLF